MITRHINQFHLAKRWGVAQKTLENWRSLGQGPAYLKLGGRIMYRMADIERFESDNLHSGSMPSQSPQFQGARA